MSEREHTKLTCYLFEFSTILVRAKRDIELGATIVAKYVCGGGLCWTISVAPSGGAETLAIGYGGALVSAAIGLARETIRKGTSGRLQAAFMMMCASWVFR